MIDVGEYDVRGLMVESFKFKDRDYLVSRTSSNVLDCTITINPNPPMRELSEADRTMEYGATLSDIANKLSSTSGLYKVAASEIALDANIESKILPYDVYYQTSKFDYFKTNDNTIMAIIVFLFLFFLTIDSLEVILLNLIIQK
mgnify:CR=1 FL=1